MRVTSKGQVTIPKHIREHLGIKPGSEVEFVDAGDGNVHLVRTRNGDRRSQLLRGLEDWLQRLEGTGDSGLKADDIMAMTRGRANGHDR